MGVKLVENFGAAKFKLMGQSEIFYKLNLW